MDERRDIPWLIALEALLFLSIPCWEISGSWGNPMGAPWRFGGVLIVGATVAMLAFHVGPALLARQTGGRDGDVLARLFAVWVGVGLVEWLVRLWPVASVATGSIGRLWGVDPRLQWELAITALAFAVIGVAGLVRGWWKIAAAGLVLVGGGLLLHLVATNWHGFWVRNPYFRNGPEQEDWLLLKGLLLSAAPAGVIGWRIGRVTERASRIWYSGFLGVWMPAAISVTLVAIAVQGGMNLHWRPSLTRTFVWALLCDQGRLDPRTTVVAVGTLLGPAMVMVNCLRAMRHLVRSRVAVGLSIAAGVAAAWAFRQDSSTAFSSVVHQFWTVSLGAIGFLACCVMAIRGLRRTRASGPGRR